jgi:hypothetical protein
MKKTIAAKLENLDEFYRQPCWLELWRKTCDPCRLTFWSRIDETNAAILISYWETAGFLTRARKRTRYRVHSTYYSQLKFYTLKPRPRIPGTKKAKPIQNTLYFRTVCQRIWMSMRILQTFSIGQLQACSNVCNDIVRTFVTQLYQLNYVRLQVCHGSNFEGNEDIYQLIRNTGARRFRGKLPPKSSLAKALFLCGEGSLYDLSTYCIYFTD